MFSARELSRLAGFEKRWMLNHLEREKIFVPQIPRPRRSGKWRTYTVGDLIVLRAINRLLALGSRPKKIEMAIHQFAAACPEITPTSPVSEVLAKFAKEAGHFVVTGNSVIYVRSATELIDLIHKGQLAFSFMVDNNVCTAPCLQAAEEVSALNETQRRDERLIDKIAKKYAL